MGAQGTAAAVASGQSTTHAVAPLWLQPLRWTAVLATYAYYHTAYRCRRWGSMPHRRGPALLVGNHQHDVEATVVVSSLTLDTFSWRYPIFSAAGRRMWEPGFLGNRVPWLDPLLHRLSFGWLFEALGLEPIENELHTRTFASLAYSLSQAHGALLLRDVFRESALARLPPELESLPDLLRQRYADIGRTQASLSELNEPYRGEMLAATRELLDADRQHFAQLVRSGATVYLTPEGHYSADGRMRRLRGLFATLAPLARIWLAGISYDPFVGRRLSMLWRVVPATEGVALEAQIKASRPVTTSALLATWLHGRSASFSARDACDAVQAQLAALPKGLFVDPELRARPERMVRSALAGLQRTGTVRVEGLRYVLTEQRAHPQFPQTNNMIAFLRNFHEETLEGARSLA
jgi:hypothetical protein